MKPLNNPFVEYGYKGPEYFCDREEETGQLVNALYNESNIALISPRRIGKSGLIKHVFNRMEASSKDVACIYIDILNTRNQRDFIDVMATSVVQKTRQQLAISHAKSVGDVQGLACHNKHG